MKVIGTFRTGVAAGTVFTVLILSQCSPRASRNLLTFFFDGAPLQDSSLATGADPLTVLQDSANYLADTEPTAVETMVNHYPYQEGDCRICHDPVSPAMLVEPEPGLCYLCHEDFNEQYNYLHGPVAGGYCTACHNPHRSENSGLTRFTGQQQCIGCHLPEQMERSEMHQDLEGMSCTDCHNPHGGEDRFILY